MADAKKSGLTYVNHSGEEVPVTFPCYYGVLVMDEKEYAEAQTFASERGPISMRRCKNCMWWDDEKAPSVGAPQGWGTCILAESADGLAPDHPETLVYGEALESAGLTTAPDFGCIMWERKA